jgi:protein-S-isoprenylcysteine O-methyltransferase Ste14
MRWPEAQVWLRGIVAATFVGSAGAWNGPTVWVLAMISGVTFFHLGWRDQRERTPGTEILDDWLGPAMQVASVLWLAAAAFENRGPERTWDPPGLWDLGGGLLIYAGIRLRRAAAEALGRHFTVALSVLDDHELVDDGPYRRLRHPNYAGLLLIALGTAIMVKSPLAIAVALSLWLPLALLRIRAEERVLSQRLGSRWTEYASERWSLVPGVY